MWSGVPFPLFPLKQHGPFRTALIAAVWAVHLVRQRVLILREELSDSSLKINETA